MENYMFFLGSHIFHGQIHIFHRQIHMFHAKIHKCHNSVIVKSTCFHLFKANSSCFTAPSPQPQQPQVLRATKRPGGLAPSPAAQHAAGAAWRRGGGPGGLGAAEALGRCEQRKAGAAPKGGRAGRLGLEVGITLIEVVFKSCFQVERMIFWILNIK